MCIVKARSAFDFGRQHTGRRVARVVDQQRVGVAVPFDRVGRVGHDRLERLVVPVGRVDQRVAVGDVELLVRDVVQEHVDPAQVVGGQVDLLAEVALPHLAVAEDLLVLQQHRPGATGRVVDLVDLGLADDRDPGQELGDLLRRVVLTAGLAGRRGVHLHEVLVGVAEQVVVVLRERAAEREVADGVEQLDELLVALGHGRAELAAVDVEVVEETLDVVLGVRADGRAFDVLEDAAQRLVEVLVVAGLLADVGEQVLREDVEALLLDRLVAAELRVGVCQVAVVEVRRCPPAAPAR